LVGKKPLAGLDYSAVGFLTRGFFAAAAGFATGAFFAGTFFTGFSSTIGAKAGATSTTTGVSTLYGATGSGAATGGVGLTKKAFKNRNIMFSYTVIY
jgi:hypothetical protein